MGLEINTEERRKQKFLHYLRLILGAATKLSARENAADKDGSHMSERDFSKLIQSIGENLLRSCTPNVLALEASDLPDLRECLDARTGEAVDKGDDDYADNVKWFEHYQYRRSDYLRLLLRQMAPISFDVAAAIFDSSINYSDSSAAIGQLEIFILFSHWLPVAPHLTSMAIDFMSQMKEPWVALDTWNLSTTFLLVEGSHMFCKFLSQRNQVSTVARMWNWTFLFRFLAYTDVDIPSSQGGVRQLARIPPVAVRLHAIRCIAHLLEWEPQIISSILEKLKLSEVFEKWEPHPWIIQAEERQTQCEQLRQCGSVWGTATFEIPTTEEVICLLSPSRLLIRIKPAIIFYKDGSLRHTNASSLQSGAAVANPSILAPLVPTLTTMNNISLLATALCQEPYPPPILICGPHGSGKSSLLRDLLRLCRPRDSLIEFHIDEETDSKTLIGSYSTTDIPGEFAWRAGALTHASRQGRWVLFEDIDSVPMEIQATLVQLLENRVLPLGNGKYEKCHPNFRVFATCTTDGTKKDGIANLRFAANRGGGKRILSLSLWRKVHVTPLPFIELKEIVAELHPGIPASIVDSALSILEVLDQVGRSGTHLDKSLRLGSFVSWTGGRIPSVRDFFKLIARISTLISFENNVTYTTEAQRTLCMAESVDVFVGSCVNRELKHEFVGKVAALTWGLSQELAVSYFLRRRPTTQVGADFVTIGRAKLFVGRRSELAGHPSASFAQTNHVLRLMEAVGVCVQQNEPVLLVGETGCGKTSVIQQLARLAERDLIVQNLSLQTDSTDLLGGFKPLEVKNVARKTYEEFVNLFVSTFSRKQNSKFLQFAALSLEKENWKKLSQCFHRASHLGNTKMKQESFATNHDALSTRWKAFEASALKFERQMISCESGLAFEFSEGALVDAIQQGKWVLLDEINLASSDTLQRLCGLLDDPSGSIILTERGDDSAIRRHPNFRLFAAMNPATDAGKKDLPTSIRSRFSELYVNELLDPLELRVVAAKYMDGVLPVDGKPPEHKEIVVKAVDVYLRCREMADTSLSDGSGHKPRYTLRTLSRALGTAKLLTIEQRLPLTRALFEGFQLGFQGALDSSSTRALKKVLKTLLSEGVKTSDLDHPGRRPGFGSNEFVLIKPFWIKTGPRECEDWSDVSSSGRSRFILTPAISSSLRSLSRALASGPWPVLLEGPTSAGKTTLVEYIAARCGHHVVRINNHEHTDVQEYTGSFAADHNGSLSFRDGLLVKALRAGHWVILDELNLAPSEVLEALNRLLDDNRELYLPETNETVKPHPNFRLFATQNPSGAYGGRKPLSRAFRNRFVEIHMGDIPSAEMITILEKRCGCPPSSAKRLVEIMEALRFRRSKSNVFLGKDSFITPRDLLRWAERKAGSKLELAQQGFMLLAERLRSTEEKEMVRSVLEEHFKVKLNMAELYYGEKSMAMELLENILRSQDLKQNSFISSIAPTKSLLRLISLVLTCVEQKEPVLLVGDTGCGKTTVVQFLSLVFKKELHAVNLHATTETSDLLGGLRPVRGRENLRMSIYERLCEAYTTWPYPNLLNRTSLQEVLSVGGDGRMIPLNTDDQDLLTVEKMLALAKEISKCQPTQPNDLMVKADESRTAKRRKLDDNSESVDGDAEMALDTDRPMQLLEQIQELGRRHGSLFEWADGPLVKAMKEGNMLLLDEMSLAEDAVLERLNSVLEPSRTLVLAEKGDEGSQSETRVVIAHDEFRVFATMNPGGDFGKRELSPALRSRFTEIWVPQITERDDLGLVLGKTLKQDISGPKLEAMPLLSMMLEYLEWFNKIICGRQGSPFTGYALSLRDVLSWARFITESRAANHSIGIWEAYVHGASLMHLDGLGLGSGLALEDATALRSKADAFISKQIPAASQISPAPEKLICVDKATRRFGASPFMIPLGPVPSLTSAFNMAAPTTAKNAFRVLRAMQLRKPVILEGSPGVGKTSLITALASASGHKLVRINLSEQTDISDLFGSDLPVQDAASGSASFQWCDGILLTAIKEGSWVLLDELNLASQSVLEGLNSCLDHRATVFIPELGTTFDCPSTFRVFGAQNPLGQGGGRKGLPKSFLNRFTKVYVDGLTDYDLHSIVNSMFPSFDRDIVSKMIGFNNRLNHAVVVNREFGAEGSPWEFNLRDVFRLCELIESNPALLRSYARDLYYQRFRNPTDRLHVDNLFKKFFGISMLDEALPQVVLSDRDVSIGSTVLRRTPIDKVLSYPVPHDPELYLSRLLPTEAVARCVKFRWPCLLIGPPTSGKTSTVSSLAKLCNATLREQCLSPSSDVTELLGCFEQVETLEYEKKIASCAIGLVGDFFVLKALDSTSCPALWESAARLRHFLINRTASDNRKSVLEVVTTIRNSIVGIVVEGTDEFLLLKEQIHKLNTLIEEGIHNEHSEGNSGHFVWRDGVLVEAMEKGYWLLLDNVNLCPSSVLDRLNSVTERNGHLLLSECGASDSNGISSHRLIKPHENFRIFFCMNPANGEISRAMRNRCVEIYLPSTFELANRNKTSEAKLSQGSRVDLMGSLSKEGARTLNLANRIIEAHVREQTEANERGGEGPCFRNLTSSVGMMSSLLLRGVDSNDVLNLFHKIAHEKSVYSDNERSSSVLLEEAYIPLFSDGSIQSKWLSNPKIANTRWDGRDLNIFAENHLELPAIVKKSVLIDSEGDDANSLRMKTLERRHTIPGDSCGILQMSTSAFVNRAMLTNFKSLALLFAGSKTPSSPLVAWMIGAVEKDILAFSDAHPDQVSEVMLSQLRLNEYLSAPRMSIMRERLDVRYHQSLFFVEEVSMNHFEDNSSLNVLKASYFMFDSSLDSTTINCPVTPLVYPFFLALDAVLRSVVFGKAQGQHEKTDLIQYLQVVFLHRDRLWYWLSDTRLLLKSSFLGFEEGPFLVQWKWLIHSYRQLISTAEVGVEGCEKLEALITRMNSIVFADSQGSSSLRAIAKLMHHPEVPRTASHWQEKIELEDIASACSIELPSWETTPVSLSILRKDSHPLLFMEKEFKVELLALLATVHFSWENGTGGTTTSSASENLKHMISKKQNVFSTEVAQAQVDTSITTIENAFVADQLDELAENSRASVKSSEAYSRISNRLLDSFAEIQLSSMREYISVVHEQNILSAICQHLILCRGDEDLQKRMATVRPAIEQYMKRSAQCSVWSVAHLLPYQLCHWLLETTATTSAGLCTRVKPLLIRMVSARAHHLYTNSYSRSSAISTELELPNMWFDEELETTSASNDNIDKRSIHQGSWLLGKGIRHRLLLQTVGPQLKLSSSHKSSRFFTMENYQQRLHQYSSTVSLLSADEQLAEKSELWLLVYLFCDVLTAIGDGLGIPEIEKLQSHLGHQTDVDPLNMGTLQTIVQSISSEPFKAMFESIVLRVIQALRLAIMTPSSHKDYIKSIGAASAYIGLLRLEVSTPASPLDPGREPTAKILLMSYRLNWLQRKLMSKKLYSSIVLGSFKSDSLDVTNLLEESEVVMKKQEEQKQKIVERPPQSATFVDLFQQTRSFIENSASQQKVEELINCILSSPSQPSTRLRIETWLQTTSSFCEVLSSGFRCYEDITLEIVNSLRMIQEGIESLFHVHAFQDNTTSLKLFTNLCCFPSIAYDDTVEQCSSYITNANSLDVASKDASGLQLGIVCSALSRLVQKQESVGLSEGDFQACFFFLDSILPHTPTAATEPPRCRTSDEVAEQVYREQFPDHHTDFKGLFTQDSDEIEEVSDHGDDSSTIDENTSLAISDSYIEIIWTLFRCLFSCERVASLDSIRMLSFHCGIDTAFALESVFECSQNLKCEKENMSSFFLGLSLTLPPKDAHSTPFSYLRMSNAFGDFQNEPNPFEVLQARSALEALMARSTQLLTAFPGHSILLGIGRVCDRVCKFDTMTTPIGKFMTGLEVILRHAQEWEQHASERVRLGDTLKAIGKLVTKWRKLELQSWPDLVAARRARHEKRGRRHFIRLLSILSSDATDFSPGSPINGNTKGFIPIWVWKGSKEAGLLLSDGLDTGDSDDLGALMKILDTFALTSSLGEFESRLYTMKVLATKLEVENRIRSGSAWKLQQMRALVSIHDYYAQFLPVFTAKLEAMINPIQSKIKDEVKLAKWDDQTFYALAESTEKNHRKLMKILSEVDECLNLNVGHLIQQESIRGIRANVDSRENCSTDIPSISTMFSQLPETNSSEAQRTKPPPEELSMMSEWKWTSTRPLSKDAAFKGKYLNNLEKYGKKMIAHTKMRNLEVRGWVSRGNEIVEALCSDIFERIDSLRNKATRPMKERALVDLFRELKNHGFTTTKWAVPNEIRSIECMFQLPKPKKPSNLLSTKCKAQIDKAEKYYQRCLSEMNTYRSESLLLGSKDLGKREVDLMLTLGESGMILIAQQRCMISALTTDLISLGDSNNVINPAIRNMLQSQSKHVKYVEEFEQQYFLSIECLNQLSLLLRSSQMLLDGSQLEWARDAMVMIDQCTTLFGDEKPRPEKIFIVEVQDIRLLEFRLEKLGKVQNILTKCKQSCHLSKSFPPDAFDSLISSIENAQRLAKVSVSKSVVGGLDMANFYEAASSAVEKILISYQGTLKFYGEAEQLTRNQEPEGEHVLWTCHKKTLKMWAETGLFDLDVAIKKASQALKDIHDCDTSSAAGLLKSAVGMIIDIGILAKHVETKCLELLAETICFHANSAKLVYVVLRVFRVLLSKGFCSDETAEGEDGEADGDVSGMTFEDDKDGTGMGDGEGKRDVSDQLESEEQLAGLKAEQDNEEDANQKQESRQLNEEEADQGMEMETDFDGEMCDIPENQEANEDDEGDEEELDREMGDDTSPDEQVVDEQMWNESDDENDIDQENEKFEKDSGVEGDAIEGATRTKEDGAEEKNEKNEEEQDSNAVQQDEQGNGDIENDHEEPINEDSEDKYEERHGVDVKPTDDEPEEQEQEMKLDDCLNLDENEGGDDEASMAMDNDPEKEEDEDPDMDLEADRGNMDLDDQASEDEQSEDGEMNPASIPAGVADPADMENDQDADEEENDDKAPIDVDNQNASDQQAHGLKSQDGADAVIAEEETNEEDPDKESKEASGDTSGSADANKSQSESQGGDGVGQSDGAFDESKDTKQEDQRDEIPNPMKNPGDAKKFWHRKLNIIDEQDADDIAMEQPGDDMDNSGEPENQDPTGDYQHTSEENELTTQVLGETTQEEAVELPNQEADQPQNEELKDHVEKETKKETPIESKSKNDKKKVSRKEGLRNDMDEDMDEEPEEDQEQNEDVEMSEEDGDDPDQNSMTEASNGENEERKSAEVVSDLSRLKVEEGQVQVKLEAQIIEDEHMMKVSNQEAEEARSHWLQIQGETYSLSRRLCEKLRLVMEPLVASKLRGDYRTGKRINMKRVIGYIASGYRKDKIWLRRTKPAKRNYRVLLAVDDSESMKKSGAGEMALRALATLAVGMNQLEIGELGIASFGEDMRLLHPFNSAFTSETGADMVMNFRFDQKRTRTSLCVESAIGSLEAMGDASSVQLVFLISDGRIERDSRETLKRLIREMMERNILLAMIIVEGDQKKKDSIVNMKEVTFQKGKPVVKRFIEDYPFPYYIILDDMTALPEVLGDALKQWFEMLAQMQSAR